MSGHTYSLSSNVKDLSMNLDEHVFLWEKWNFESIGNSAHTTEVFASGKSLLKLLLFYLQILKILTSTQTDNHT